VTDQPRRSTTRPPTPDVRRNGQRAVQPGALVVSTPDDPIHEQVQWHLAEVTGALRDASAPLDPALLGVVLRGLADLCWLLHDRGHESAAQPTVLFRDHPVVAEALGMWARRLGPLATQQHTGR
jgi:hypothetical protein